MQIEFQKNLNEDSTKLLFTKDDLEGLPDDFINGLKPGEKDGEYYVTLQYPDLVPVLKLAKKEETRKKLDAANAAKCQAENTPLMEKVLQLRRGNICYEFENILFFLTFVFLFFVFRTSKIIRI